MKDPQCSVCGTITKQVPNTTTIWRCPNCGKFEERWSSHEAGPVRPTREALHMIDALKWSSRSLCHRLKVGAVITTGDLKRVLSIGYNGPAKGLPHDRCKNTPGTCGCLHAEDNAIAMVDSTIPDKALFVTHQPCEQCAQRVIQANIHRVYYLDTYRSDAGASLLNSVGILTSQLTLKPSDFSWVPDRFRTQPGT